MNSRAIWLGLVLSSLGTACGGGKSPGGTGDAGGDAEALGDAGLDSGHDATVDAGTITLDPLADVVAIPGTPLGPLAITIHGAVAPNVTVDATSLGTPTVVHLAASSLVLGGSGLARTLTITGLAASDAGRYTVTVSIDEGGLHASQSFVLRVNAPPSLALIADTGTVAGFAIPAFTVSVYDDAQMPQTITLDASSSDEAFLPVSGIELSPITPGAGGNGGFTITLVPADASAGEADVTIHATDPEGASDSRTFHVTVAATAASGVELVSRTSTLPYTGGDDRSEAPAASGDGQIVVFTSHASNLAGGMLSAGDIFVRDRSAGTTTRLGIVGISGGATISPNGRYVAFSSTAAALAGGDTNAAPDVFVYDRTLQTYDRVSVASDETPANGASSLDPSYVGAPYRKVAISDDGRYVAFESDATNLVANDTNGKTDVFLRDRTLGTTVRVSESTSGVEANGPCSRLAMSGDGTTIAFTSTATNLVDGSTESDAHDDVYVRAAGTLVRATSASTGGAANGASATPSLSADGRYLVYSSAATNLLASIELYGKTDLYVLDRDTNTTTRLNFDLAGISQADCYDPVISADGDRIAFRSDALFPGDENGFLNAYLLERSTTTFTFIGESLVGSGPNGGTGYAVSLSADGALVVFQSAASNLFPGDANGQIDVFAEPVP